jgi:hypothetical protein
MLKRTTFPSVAEFPSRSNSDAKALYEVREILRNDLSKYHGTIKPGRNHYIGFSYADLVPSPTISTM